MRRVGRCVLLAIGIAALAIVPAEAQRYHFDHLTTSDGLAAASVFKIDQDSRGYMWFSTSEGLSRWDGTSVTSFDVSTGMHDQRIYSMARDASGSIWLGTEQGISVYDGRMVRNFTSKDGLGQGAIWDIVVDRFGHVWAGTQAGGVSVFDGRRFRSYSVANGIADPYVCALLADPSGTLWIGTREAGLYAATIDESGGLTVRHHWTTAEGLPSDYVSSVVRTPGGEIWVGTRTGGLSHIEGNRASAAPSNERGDVIYTLLLLRSGDLAVGTLGGGVSICAPPGFTSCRTLTKRSGLLDDDVVSLYEDRENGLWIGTGLGVSRWTGDQFESFTDLDGIEGRIYGVTADGNDAAWVSTARGVFRVELLPGTTGQVDVTSIGPERGLPATDTWDVLRDSRRELWIATAVGLCRYDSATGCRMYTTRDGLPSSYVSSVFEDRDGNIWAGTERGAARLRRGPHDGDVEFDAFGAAQGLATLGIYSIAQGRDGRIWFASSGGVSSWDGVKFRNYSARDGLGVDTINDVAVLRDGSVWFATSGAGLARYEPASEARGGAAFRTFGREYGLPTAAVMAVAELPDGHLLAGTLRGVVEIDPRRAATPGGFVVRHFTRRDGLAGDETGSGSGISISPGGTVWFGQVAGVTRYFRSARAEASVAPTVTIDSVRSKGRMLFRAPFSSMSSSDGGGIVRLHLDAKSRDLAFQFRGVSLSDQHNVLYQTRLDGYDADWSDPQRAAFKEYTNLAPGRYLFRVRASNSSGAWSEPATMEFSLDEPLWKRAWIRLVALLLAALLLIQADKLRMSIVRQRQASLEALVAARTATLEQRTAELERANELIREADRAKSRFLASMSHELRTPLNSIIGFTELLVERGGDVASDRALKFLGNVRHSAQHLLGLINDILDISKIEAGRMEIHIDHVSIRGLAESTIETIQGFAVPRQIRVASTIPDDLPLAQLDGMKVRQILYNLLSNAIKFSLAGGVVELSISHVGASRSPLGVDAFELTVTDHGSGIPPSELSTIFDEFRQSLATSKLGLGTGLGLAIVGKFAKMQGGQVTVESSPGQGSTFRVWLPVDAQRYDTEVRKVATADGVSGHA